MHHGKTPASYAECGKCSYRASDFERQYRIHTGEKTYKFNDYSKSFAAPVLENIRNS